MYVCMYVPKQGFTQPVFPSEKKQTKTNLIPNPNYQATKDCDSNEATYLTFNLNQSCDTLSAQHLVAALKRVRLQSDETAATRGYENTKFKRNFSKFRKA